MHPQDPRHHPDHERLERLADRVVEKLRPELHQLANRILKGMKTMADDINTELQADEAEEAALAQAVAANTAVVQKYQTDLAAALASVAAGQVLTSDQLAAFQAVHDKMAADVAAINTADAPAA